MEHIDLRALVVGDEPRFVRSAIDNCLKSLGAESTSLGWQVSTPDVRLLFSAEVLSPTVALDLLANPENADQFDAVLLRIEAGVTDCESYVAGWTGRLPRPRFHRPFLAVWSSTI